MGTSKIYLSSKELSSEHMTLQEQS